MVIIDYLKEILVGDITEVRGDEYQRSLNAPHDDSFSVRHVVNGGGDHSQQGELLSLQDMPIGYIHTEEDFH